MYFKIYFGILFHEEKSEMSSEKRQIVVNMGKSTRIFQPRTWVRLSGGSGLTLDRAFYMIMCQTSKSTQKWLNKHKISVLLWPSQSLCLTPSDNLWSELKKEVHIHKPESLKEFKMFCMKEWAKIRQSVNISNHVGHYTKRLSAVIFSRVGITTV